MEAAPLSEGKTGNPIVQLRAIVQLHYCCVYASSVRLAEAFIIMQLLTMAERRSKSRSAFSMSASMKSVSVMDFCTYSPIVDEKEMYT